MTKDSGVLSAQIREWNDTATAYPRDACLHELFARCAAACPDATAARHGDRRLTYGELARQSLALARRLRAAGVGPGSFVGVSGGRSLEALVALLGILRAGAAYVPLDENHPVARLRAMAEDAEVRAVVMLPGSVCPLRDVDARLRLQPVEDASKSSGVPPAGTAIPGQAPHVGPARGLGGIPGGPERHGAAAEAGKPAVTAEDCAYVMFTSGTTGRPKPVAVPHRGVVRLARGADHLTVVPQDRVLHGYSPSSDASTIEIWSALLNGACLVLVDTEVLLTPHALRAEIEESGVTVAFLTTGVLHHIARTGPDTFAGLRFLSAGGEALDPDLTRRVLAESRPGRLVNFYGPTENTVISTAHLVDEVPQGATSVPIGRPVSNSCCYVLRPDGTHADVGETGELLVGGDGLALGYLGEEELTADRFIPDPFRRGDAREGQQARVYRTGDLACWRPDGALEFQGRADRQVKLHGFRVELDEVENALRSHPAVGEAIVEVVDGPGTAPRLTACVTSAAPDRPAAPQQLRAALARWLPRHAVPVDITVLAAFPVAANGKVDRDACARLAAESRSATGAGTAATGGEEQLLDDGPAAAPSRNGKHAQETRPGDPDELQADPLRQALAQLWELVLHVPVGPDDSFFALGGDSLQASEMVTRALRLFQLDARVASNLVRSLLRNPTLRSFGAAVREARRAPAATQGEAPMTTPRNTPDAAAERSGWRTVDFDAEARLGVTLPQKPAGEPVHQPPREILLTGATGFLGAFLLDRLLRRSTARVHLPVRSRDSAHALRRLRSTMARYRLPGPSEWPPGRVVCFPAELSAPGLGLCEDHARKLSGHLDLIVHAAAQVNFLYPYEQLRAANVEGTREIVRLAAPRRVPVHFVSSIAVAAGFGSAGVRHLDEDRPLEYADRLTMGYAESKWVGERLLQDAADAGLPVAVHRPYEITGERHTGICNTQTAICSLFRAIAEIGLAPDLDLPLDFVPVDHVAEALTHIVLTRPAERHVYHLTNPRPAALADMVERMRAAGYRIGTLPYADWVGALVRHVAENPTSPTAPFVPLCVDQAHKSRLSVKELYVNGVFPQLGRRNVERALAGSGLHCPPVDDALLDRYLEHFFQIEYLRRPRTSAPPVPAT
ncbi:amino acid adenylation domain-containing protein [Streptomyces sp. 891-h]|uniref:amino acid adenylation domain-containing protein n=1 Tax=Streptomyces sp. 891-h TaxID=2720714 RepID=UPI001FA9B985|nr:amino acid adenylation domain-containing protein [Streptomyces sp. 891-h]UNZ21039.1 amino acid adenylation domain-containing protein [Streptomyces sp. 891-h]